MGFPSANKAFVMGQVSSPPQIKDIGNGRSMMGFRLVSKRSWKDKEFQTTHRITVFGNAVDGLRDLSEGSLVGVDGRIDNRQYEQNGEKKWITEIVANDVQVFSATESSKEEDFGEIPF
jgi:single-strand DNA-binding protein